MGVEVLKHVHVRDAADGGIDGGTARCRAMPRDAAACAGVLDGCKTQGGYADADAERAHRGRQPLQTKHSHARQLWPPPRAGGSQGGFARKAKHSSPPAHAAPRRAVLLDACRGPAGC